MPRLEWDEPLQTLGRQVRKLAEEIGAILAQYEPISAGYRIGEIYTALLPADFRAKHGVFYTPPALTHRLLHLASKAGVDWAKARVLDPGCGGGAFLTPVALKILSALDVKDPRRHPGSHLHPRSRIRAGPVQRVDLSGRPGVRVDRGLPRRWHETAWSHHGL